MRLPPFSLDRWLNRYLNAETPIEFDLGSSTGPHWTLGELLALDPSVTFDELLKTKVLYSHARGAERLRRAVAGIYGADPDHVQITTGAAEALHILFFLAAEPGANVVIPSPVFPPTGALPKAYGLEIRSYRLRRERAFAVDLDEIARLVDRDTRLLLVNTPHNPTGAVASESELHALRALAQEHGARLVVDIVYDPIHHAGAPGPRITSLPGAIIVGDTSKALSLSGLRIGWIVDQDLAAQAFYEDTRSYFTVSNSPLNEVLAAIAVEQREKIYERARDVTRPNLALLHEFMLRHESRFGWIRPQGAMTAFPWVNRAADARPFCEFLARHGVVVVPGDCFGYPEHFRLGFGASGERFAAAIDRIESVLPQWAPAAATA